MGSLPNCCQVCGLKWNILEDAHIQPRRHFPKSENSKYHSDYNLVRLCPNHHKIMDRAQKLVICPGKRHYIFEKPDGTIYSCELVVPALVKTDYLSTSYKLTNITGLNSTNDVAEICGCGYD